MDSFSMKELRQELDRIGVDYSACIEKKEMIELLHKNTHQSFKAARKVSASKRCADRIPQAKTGEMPKKLSIKSIKERLTALGVDFSSCLEIGELVELLVASEQGHNANPFRGTKVRQK
jgi:hypothetical protein